MTSPPDSFRRKAYQRGLEESKENSTANLAGYDDPLDFAGTLANLQQFRVPEESFDVVFLH